MQELCSPNGEPNRCYTLSSMTTRNTDAPRTESVVVPRSFQEQYLVAFGLLFLFCWLVLNGCETVERIFHYYVALPDWDYWRVPENLSKYQKFQLSALWRQHNDHRIVFPEIVFALDMLVLHGRLILPLAVSIVAYVGTWLLLSSTLWADASLAMTQVGQGAAPVLPGVPLPARALAFGATSLAGVIVLWQGSAALLATPFQLQWTLMQLAVACSLVLLSKLKETSSGFYLAGVIAAAVVANYSSGNGLMVWPLLLVLALALRLERRKVIILGIASLTFIALYFVGYQFGADLNIRNVLTHPLYLLEYAASYLSMPFGGMKSPEFGVRVGVANLLIILVLFVIASRRGLLSSRPGIVLFGSYAFTLLTIFITAAGRMEPADPTFRNAKPPRYVTVPMMNWAVFILLSLWISFRARWKVLSPRLVAALISLLLLLYLPKLGVWLTLVTQDFSEQQVSALGLENEVVDSNLIRKIFPSVDFVLRYLPKLREQHLSIYYKSHAHWLGKPLSSFSRNTGEMIPGQITSTFPLQGGVEIIGWADGSTLRRAYSWLVFTNEHNTIIGFGRRLPAGFPAFLTTNTTPPSLSWVGFVNLSIPVQFISAYAVDLRRGGLFRIAGSIPVPSTHRATPQEAAEAITGLTWQRDPTWTETSLPTGVDFGQVPSGVIYGSWSGNDVNQGQITSSIFSRPTNSCVILPVLHGPMAAGLTVDLIDADNGQSVAAAPMQNADDMWEYWRIPLPTSVQHLRILARDAGKDWGEWVALATPLTCR